jgi:branched-chain amino acid transport system permease protein
MTNALQTFANGITLGFIYSLVAIPIVLVYKASKVFNFAHGGIMLLGGLILYTFLYHLPLWLVVPLTIIAVGIMGYIIQRIVLTPLIGQPILSLILATMALLVLFNSLSVAIWGAVPCSYPSILPMGSIMVGPVKISKPDIIEILVIVAILGLLGTFLNYTKYGLAMMVTSEGHLLAQSLGIRVKIIFALAWIIAAILATVGGFFVGYKLALSEYLPEVALRSFAVVLLGGLESVKGAIIAGLIMGNIEAFVNFYLGDYIPGIGVIAPYIGLLLIMCLKPYGLFGWVRIERV